MPTLERVQNFIARVEQQDYVAAIMHFYHEDASMQENLGEPRRGRDTLVAHEMDVLARFGNMPVRKVERFAVNGDIVFINWIFEIRQPDGSFRPMDEIAVQEWDGDRIRHEQFYYDPGQMRAPSAT
jgi:ketosteroid isomerase-like protein